jgi:hypothetical protein
MRYEPHQVTPFGNPRINACVRLSGAYRSLPRPSSPAGAKASTTYPLNLTLRLIHLTLRQEFNPRAAEIGLERLLALLACYLTYFALLCLS